MGLAASRLWRGGGGGGLRLGALDRDGLVRPSCGVCMAKGVPVLGALEGGIWWNFGGLGLKTVSI